MANSCYADFNIICPDSECANKLKQTLHALMKKEDNAVNYLEIGGCFLSYVYIFQSGFTFHIESQVEWGFSDKEVKALFRWFKNEGDICEFEVTYEETASHMYGTFFWEDMEPDFILHTYLPEEQWPEDEDDAHYFGAIAKRFEQNPKDRKIRLTRKKKTT